MLGIREGMPAAATRPSDGAETTPEIDATAPLAVLRWPLAGLVALVFALPFLLTDIPPLVDLPGHIGRLALADIPAGSALNAYFSYHWALVLNLGTDLLIQALRPLAGLFGATWLVCAAIPVITAAGVLAISRQLNPRGAHALPWALMFVFHWPFLYGFINFSFSAGLSLLAFALWLRLARRQKLRGMLSLVILPLLMVSHAIGGGLAAVMIGSYEFWRRRAWLPANWRWPLVAELARTLSPLIGCFVAIVLWRVLGGEGGGRTVWLMERKPEAFLMALRDQNIVLDIGSVAAAFAVLGLGRLWGARFRPGAAGPAVAMLLLVLCLPAILSGADRIDTRLAPMVPMLALALQDWSGVQGMRRRWVAIAGAVLLAVRLAVTSAGFIAYDRSYASELGAIEHIRPGTRVLNFTTVGCKLSDWRVHRLEHLSNLVTPLRSAWVNSHWVIDGVNLIQVRYRPSERFYSDASEIIFPARCIDPGVPLDKRSRRTIDEVLREAPIDRVDYLWLVNARLPADYAGPALDKKWSNGTSELYAVRTPVPLRPSRP